MKAVGVAKFGGPEVLQVFDLPEPHAGPHEVRIRVHMAAVNPTDVLVRQGAAAARFADRPPPYIPGMDAAGVIDEVGPENDGRLRIGDRVVALIVPTGPHMGAYAEQVVVPAASVVAAPHGKSLAADSTFLMNALTARLALDELALQPGQSLAVTGAAGALGGDAIQLAKADGLRVIADAKQSDRELVKQLGADDIVERGEGVAERIRAILPNGVDGVIDAALLHEAIVPAIADHGGLATFRGWNEPVPRGIKVHSILVTRHAEDTEQLERLREQAEDGTLTLRVAKVLPASRAADAHRMLEAGGVRGRLVLDFGHVS